MAARSRGIFVAATKQHVGKTTTSLGLVSGIKKRLGSCGFIKPVGQQHIEVAPGVRVDKDVNLFRRRFDINAAYEDMSPVLIPKGYTKRFLDGEVRADDQFRRIKSSFERISAAHAFTVCEGTGHAGVGAIVQASNADVASALDLDTIIVATGGLGSAFDELELNYHLFKKAGVRVRGVVLNRVLPEKRDTVCEYFSKALARWDIPLIGAVPYERFLGFPTMLDFENLFKTKLLTGEEHRLRHLGAIDLVSTDLSVFIQKLNSDEMDGVCFLVHASRTDIVLGLLAYAKAYEHDTGRPFVTGVILCGSEPLGSTLRRFIESSRVPILHAQLKTSAVISALEGFTAKLSDADVARTDAAIDLVEQHVDFDALLAAAD